MSVLRHPVAPPGRRPAVALPVVLVPGVAARPVALRPTGETAPPGAGTVPRAPTLPDTASSPRVRHGDAIRVLRIDLLDGSDIAPEPGAGRRAPLAPADGIRRDDGHRH